MVSSNMVKVLEYLILPETASKCKLGRCQYGYRQKTSTVDAVTMMKKVIENYNREYSKVYAGFIDFSKAFERVVHRRLLLKLQQRCVSNHIVRMLSCIFANSYTTVEFNGSQSSYLKVSRGVWQGGILSAVLFAIYFEDILQSVNIEQYGCLLGIQKIFIKAYADDVVI